MSQQEVENATLSKQQQAIALISAFAAKGDMTKLAIALGQGLDAGITINEIKEILIQLYAYAGFPRSLNALNQFMQVVNARQEEDDADRLGEAPKHSIPKGDDLAKIGQANQTKLAGAPVKGALFDFAPVINQFLQNHLFGDIFERDNISWQMRELATVSMLAIMDGVDGQLKAHIGIAERTGLTKKQFEQLGVKFAEAGEGEAKKRIEHILNS